MNPAFATLTIGQAPRTDIVPVIEEALPPGLTCMHVGVLDGLTPEQVREKFEPQPGNEQLVSRLATGESVLLDRDRIQSALQQRINELCETGYELILLLCTGSFEGLVAKGAMLLEPDRVLPPL